MNNLVKLIITSFLWFQSNLCLSVESANLFVLPDPFECHQLGVETGITTNNSLGVLGTIGCESDRPAYGNANDDVRNTFSRVVLPWRYSKDGVFKDGFIGQAWVGVEKHDFESELHSQAEVTFANLAVHFGYQWFWDSGFNISVLGGGAVLAKISGNEDIVPAERSDVVSFLDKNTKTNVHGAAGFLVGWKF
jgi:hypothetical protein